MQLENTRNLLELFYQQYNKQNKKEVISKGCCRTTVFESARRQNNSRKGWHCEAGKNVGFLMSENKLQKQ